MNHADFPATVNEQRVNSSTEYRIEGDLGAVFREITRIFKEWPAFGYGTRVHKIEAVSFKNGMYAALVSRANSAD